MCKAAAGAPGLNNLGLISDMMGGFKKLYNNLKVPLLLQPATLGKI
jgi:hypothetical protein